MLPHVSKIWTLAIVTMAASSCTVRYAYTSFTEPVLQDAKTGLAIEAGGYLWNGTVFGQRGDAGLIGVYETFDFFTDAAASHVEARARWFPFEPRLVDPFVGGGVGIYRLNRTESDLRCRGRGICLSGQNDMRGQATGLTPHVVVGTEIRPGTSRGALVVAVAREFGGFDPEWDLTAWRVSAGLSFRPR